MTTYTCTDKLNHSLMIQHILDLLFLLSSQSSLSCSTGDGRWRTVIRRCSSVTETGVTNMCNWGLDPNGVYWEECYCTSDSCNGSSSITSSGVAVAALVLASLGYLWQH